MQLLTTHHTPAPRSTRSVGAYDEDSYPGWLSCRRRPIAEAVGRHIRLHYWTCSSLHPGYSSSTPGILYCDRLDLGPRRRCWHRGSAAGAAGRVVVTVDFDILTAHRVAHCL